MKTRIYTSHVDNKFFRASLVRDHIVRVIWEQYKSIHKGQFLVTMSFFNKKGKFVRGCTLPTTSDIFPIIHWR